MCELSNELKFCSCDTKSYYELENSWIIFRRKEGWLIIGQTVFNETELDIKDLEIKNLTLAVKQCNGKIFGENGAAELLGINPTTLISKLKKFEIKY